MKRDIKWHSFIEWFLCIATYAMTIITVVTACYVFANKLELIFLETNSTLYFVCTALYAGARQIRKRLYPDSMTDRRNEIVVIGWILVTIAAAFYTTFIEGSKLELLKQLVFITSVIAGILAGGEILKHVLEVFLKPKN